MYNNMPSKCFIEHLHVSREQKLELLELKTNTRGLNRRYQYQRGYFENVE